MEKNGNGLVLIGAYSVMTTVVKRVTESRWTTKISEWAQEEIKEEEPVRHGGSYIVRGRDTWAGRDLYRFRGDKELR